jgi:hypothetical protein
MPRIPQPPSLESKSLRLGKKGSNGRGMKWKNAPLENNWYDGTDDKS